LPKEFARSRRYSHALAIAICDIDRLKLVNDGFGRTAGDEVLRAFAARAAHVLRSSDWLARVGGDEFVIVLPETDLEGAARVANKVCNVMALRPFSAGTGDFRATVSIGYCAVSEPAEFARLACNDLLRKAGEQLRIAVANGRNCARGEAAEPSRTEKFKEIRRGKLTTVPAPERLTLVEEGSAAFDMPRH
jgi:diguanylate cyclase (GGDEF)-like protein